MTWTPLASAGVGFTFNPDNVGVGTVSLVGSSVVGAAAGPDTILDDSLWQIDFDAPVKMRATAVSFSTDEPFSGLDLPVRLDVGDQTMEQTGDTTMAPSPLETVDPSDAVIYYWPDPTGPEGSMLSTFEFLIEVDVPEPPTPPGEPYIIRNTARVYRGAVNNVKAWVRTEEGKLDLSAFTTLQAVIWSGSGGAFRDGYTPGAWMWPNSGQNLLFTVPVTSPELGLALFQLPPSGNTLRWIPSSLCYTILGDGVPLATGLIEVVG